MSYKVLLWGFGHMNKLILRYLGEKGHTVVAVIGHHNDGEDSATVAGLAAANGVKISSSANAAEVIHTTKPDVCILATRSTIEDLYSQLVVLGSNGVNTITIGEEAFFSWNTSPAKTKQIDELFKQHACTFSATGMQDVFWGHLPASLIGASHNVQRVVGTIRYNVDDYGRALCEAHGVGLAGADFASRIVANASPTYIWNSNEWLCAKMGWQIEETSQEIVPIMAESETVSSKSLGRSVQPGESLGLKAIVTTRARHGVTIETTMIGQVYHGDMQDLCAWHIVGEPNTELTIKNPATVEVTCACAVNRLPHLVAAQAGYQPTHLMGLI